MPNGDNGRGGLGTVRNAVTLLELLADGPAYHQLTDLAERSTSVQDVAGLTDLRLALTGSGAPEELDVVAASREVPGMSRPQLALNHCRSTSTKETAAMGTANRSRASRQTASKCGSGGVSTIARRRSSARRSSSSVGMGGMGIASTGRRGTDRAAHVKRADLRYNSATEHG